MKNCIWILWGSWPEAWVNVVDTINKHMQKEYHAIQDTDYPDYILYNKPLRWFDETWVVDESLVKKDFHGAMQKMIDMWCSIIGIACNTLHVYVDVYKQKKEIYFVDMIESVVESLKLREIRDVLVLSSATTRESWLYTHALLNEGIGVHELSDNEQKLVDTLILSMMSNTLDQEKKASLVAMLIKHKKKGIQHVVLGCTELPLLLPYLEEEMKTSLLWIHMTSSNDCLVRSCIQQYYS